MKFSIMTRILDKCVSSSCPYMTPSWRKESICWEVGSPFRKTLTSPRGGLIKTSGHSGKENVTSFIWNILRLSWTLGYSLGTG